MKEKKKRLYKKQHIVIVAVLGVISILMLFPMVWMFFTSFKTNADIRINRTSLWPEAWTLEGYEKAFTDVPFV